MNSQEGSPRITMEYDVAHDLAWSKEGDRLAIVGPFITVRDTDEPRASRRFQVPARRLARQFLHRMAYNGSEAGSFRIWDPPTRSVLLTLPGQLVRVGTSPRNPIDRVSRRQRVGLVGGISRSPICRPLGETHQYEGSEVPPTSMAPGWPVPRTGCPRGAAVYDARTGRESAWIEAVGNVSTESAKWVSRDQELITSGAAGFFVQKIDKSPREKPTLSPTHPFGGIPSEPSGQCAISPDGRLAALPVGLESSHARGRCREEQGRLHSPEGSRCSAIVR